MIRSFWVWTAVVASCVATASAGEAPVVASAESTMATQGTNVRQLAFDGEDATFFASEKPAGKGA